MWLFVNKKGEMFEITHMFDDGANETDDPDDAYTLVAKLPDGRWLATECARWQIIDAWDLE